MRPSDMSFRGEERCPVWLATLVRELEGGGDQAPPELLSPVSAVQEALAVSGAMIAGFGAPYRDDRKSLKIDLHRSFDSLGSASKALHATAIDDFRKLVNRLETLLDDLAGAHVLRAGAEILLAEVASPASRAAAFRDCVAAFEDGEFVGVCGTRLRYLRTVVEASGHDWDERAARIYDALADRDSLFWAHGALDPPHASEFEFIDEAGLTVEERLCVCYSILTSAPSPKSVVVWLVYAHAHVWPAHIKKAPAEFYDSRIWEAVLDGDWLGNPGWTQPPELRDPDAREHFKDLPKQDFVMVRVSVENSLGDSARERARDLARAAVELAGWDADWVLMDGALGHSPSGWFGSWWFADPRERDLNRPRVVPSLDPIAHSLPDLDDDLLRRIAEGEPKAVQLLADTRWRRAVRNLPDAEHRVSLAVALFERVLVPSAVGTDKWYGACQRYLELLYAFDDVAKQVWDAGYYGVHSISDTAPREDYLALDAAICPDKGDDAIHVAHSEVIRLAATLRQHLEPGSMQERMAAEMEQLTRDGASAAKWLDESRRRFDQLLARARRQRNAIAHGTRTVPGVVASVEPFLSQLAGRLIGALHYCVVEDLDLVVELERWRLLRLKRHVLLAAGGSPNLLVQWP